jgi:hypothetical protein
MYIKVPTAIEQEQKIQESHQARAKASLNPKNASVVEHWQQYVS